MDATEASKLLWEEYKYRHDVYWKSLVRWGAAIVTINVVPYVRPEIIPSLNQTVLMLPVIASVLALAGGAQLLGEYRRLQRVGTSYDGSMGIYAPTRIANSRMGKWVAAFFAIGLTILSGINGAALHRLVNSGVTLPCSSLPGAA